MLKGESTMKVRSSLVIILLLLCLLASPFVAASEISTGEISQERIELFLASQRVLAQERKSPRMKVGMVLATLGVDNEISLGVRVESRLDKQGYARVLTETVYLREEKTISGFLSLKLSPLLYSSYPVYFGGGAGYAEGFRYHVFAGVDLTEHIYVEARYANMPGGIGDSNLHLATGFQFTY